MMFGLTEQMRQDAHRKIKNQISFIENNHITLNGIHNIGLRSFFKSPFYNANRYLAELNHRAASLVNFAQSRNLVPVMLTLTLPSEYHKYVNRKINGKSRLIKNNRFIDDTDHTPREASKKLSQMLDKFRQKQAVRKIPKDDRIYFRVTEPHKSGTPHIHILYYVPLAYRDNFVAAFEEMFPDPLGRAEVDIQNPVGYLMKYCLKTLDDMRDPDKGITDLTLWYAYHGICRFYTSRTLINLSVYRNVGGQLGMTELTYMYKNNDLTVLISDDKRNHMIHDSNKVYYLRVENVACSWNRKPPASYCPVKLLVKPKKIRVEDSEGNCIGYMYDGRFYDSNMQPLNRKSLMSLLTLDRYFSQVVKESMESFGDVSITIFQKWAFVKRALIERGFIDGSVSDYPSNPTEEEKCRLVAETGFEPVTFGL